MVSGVMCGEIPKRPRERWKRRLNKLKFSWMFGSDIIFSVWDRCNKTQVIKLLEKSV